jgi:CRP-like cAMP-binding protein
MALSDQPAPDPRNRLLTALPRYDFARLWPRLEAVELPFRKVLHPPGEPIEAVYFPETGYASMLAYMEDGDAAEVGMIGHEGMVGLPVLLGADHDDIEAMVQLPGTALRMDTQAFREELDGMPTLRTLLLRYALVHHGQVARTAACNGRHHTDQRLARWLLMTHGRASGGRVPNDPRAPVDDARGAACRDHRRCGSVPEGGLHPLRGKRPGGDTLSAWC